MIRDCMIMIMIVRRSRGRQPPALVHRLLRVRLGGAQSVDVSLAYIRRKMPQLEFEAKIHALVGAFSYIYSRLSIIIIIREQLISSIYDAMMCASPSS
jgi:hypothetical protein